MRKFIAYIKSILYGSAEKAKPGPAHVNGKSTTEKTDADRHVDRSRPSVR